MEPGDDLRLVYAPFWRRLAALSLDVAVLGIAVSAIIAVANAALAGPSGAIFAPFWSSSGPARVLSETASEQTVRDEDGTQRHTIVRRDTQVFPDGTIRIFVVSDAEITAADGTVSRFNTQQMIGGSFAVYLRKALTGLLVVALSFLYFAVMEGSRRQASLGKMALGLAVVDLAGRRLSPARAVLRQVTKLVDLMTSGITYVIAGFTERHQGLHDMLAGTIVICAGTRRTATARI